MSSSGISNDAEESFMTEVVNFFDTAPPLKDHSLISKKLREFIEHNSHASSELLFGDWYYLLQLWFVST